jgi:phenylpyruvate tautomerase PptA (4-oxalocrotonate tautomerase family)
VLRKQTISKRIFRALDKSIIFLDFSKKLVPIVEITFFEYRPIEKRGELVKADIDAVSKSINVDAEGIHIILHDMRRDQWAGGRRSEI